ncbi:MAG: hypothetical protein GXO11_03375 [Epsilonproteobacteria bacterium]|nr:hypothetical protein [Campylobacterota bacterium]
MKTFSSAFAIALAMVFINSDDFIRSLILALVAVLLVVLLTAVFFYRYIEKISFLNETLKGIFSIVVSVGFYMVVVPALFFLYQWYILSSPPLSESLLESRAFIKAIHLFDVKYLNNLDPWSYRIKAERFREDLANAYRADLTFEQKELIWKNVLELYTLRYNLEELFEKLHKVTYQKQQFSYRLELDYSYATTYDLGGMEVVVEIYKDGKFYEGRIPLDLAKPPQRTFVLKEKDGVLIVTLPFIDKTLPFSKEDKEQIKKIVRYLKKLHTIVVTNRKFLKEV